VLRPCSRFSAFSVRASLIRSAFELKNVQNLVVLNLEESGKSSSKAHALIFNPLVSKILLKRSALKRASHADSKQRKLLQVESRRILRRKNSYC
jgi:hypothetical protein